MGFSEKKYLRFSLRRETEIKKNQFSFKSILGISWNPRLLNPGLFNPKSGVEKSGVGKFMVEKSGV